MIVSLRSMSYKELKDNLTKEDKIVINSCNTCVVSCGVGGLYKMTTLENMLKADGYNVLGKDLISIGCNTKLLEQHKNDIKKKEMYENATVIIPLICEDGFECMEYVFKDKKIIPIAKTVGAGKYSMESGVVLTHPFKNTGLEKTDEGYELCDIAEKLNLFEDFFDEDDAAEQETEYVTITINGEEITALKGQNLLNVCEENDIYVPHLCYHEELSEAGVCRMCLVRIKGMRDLVPSCCTHVSQGMEIVTDDEELRHNRKIILELTLSARNHNCLTCSKGVATPLESCDLQKMVREFGIEKSRYDMYEKQYDIDDSSPVISYDPNKCILCGRCVRACEEIAGLCNLGFVNRGSKTIVAAGLNVEMDQSACAACMACTNVCPTGALTEKYIRFDGKNWDKNKVFVSCEE